MKVTKLNSTTRLISAGALVLALSQSVQAASNSPVASQTSGSGNLEVWFVLALAVLTVLRGRKPKSHWEGET